MLFRKFCEKNKVSVPQAAAGCAQGGADSGRLEDGLDLSEACKGWPAL